MRQIKIKGMERAMITKQPRTVYQENPEIVLDEDFADNRVAKMRELGAVNAAPPLAPSTHLKNKFTGVIFPWSAALAEQRDILVNCDENGNTDPEAWQPHILADSQISDPSDLMTRAYSYIIKPPAASAGISKDSEDSLNQLSKAME